MTLRELIAELQLNMKPEELARINAANHNGLDTEIERQWRDPANDINRLYLAGNIVMMDGYNRWVDDLDVLESDEMNGWVEIK